MSARDDNLPALIVGAGPAGIQAAEALLRHGVRPILVDEGLRGGGQIYRQQPEGFRRSHQALYGFEAAKARRLHERFDTLSQQIDYRPETLVWNLKGDVAHLAGPEGLQEIRYGALLLATGAMDRILPLAGWTLPGVYSVGGAQVALKYQGCAIGRRVVFCGTGPLLYLVAYQYAKAGGGVAALLDMSRLSAAFGLLPGLATGGSTILKGAYYAAWLRRHGIPVKNAIRPLAFEGQERVSGVRYRSADGRVETTLCDAVAYGFSIKPETQLADLAHVPFEYDERARDWLPVCDADGRTTQAEVYLAGDGASIMGADAAELRGELAALALLQDRGIPVSTARMTALRRKLARLERFRRALDRLFPLPADWASEIDDAVIVCRCEAIRAGALRHAVKVHTVQEINRLKALTRAGMGRCQGRLCAPAMAEILAANAKLPLAAVGRLRGQAPVKPLSANVLRAGSALSKATAPEDPWSG
jgi:NADPH-dependent 2,4-dienoyl-CoA reductase/sulfur reductase-like enzyme